MEAGRGLYLGPVKSRFGVHPPDASKVGRALAAQRGDRVAPHGAMAASQLGLTKQVQVREVYLFRRSRSLKLGVSNCDPYMNGNWFRRDDRHALSDPFAASFGCNFPQRRLLSATRSCWLNSVLSEWRNAPLYKHRKDGKDVLWWGRKANWAR
jgi:hypothetical protein